MDTVNGQPLYVRVGSRSDRTDRPARTPRRTRVGRALVAISVLLGLAVPVAAQAADDPLLGEQWGLEQIRAQPAWERTQGAATTIAVIDSGIDRDHPDLAARIEDGVTFAPCPGQQPCGDGDWEDGETVATRDPHGSHVAGIAAATGGNGIGVSGAAPAASLLAVKVLEGAEPPASGTASSADVARGIRWAVDRGADVINLSLGQVPGVGQALGTAGSDLRAAMRAASDAGVVIVAAAGNESAPVCDEPAFAPTALCVVATTRQQTRAAYSNLALSASMRVVAAPGGGPPLCGDLVLSTVGADTDGSCSDVVGYGAMSGTSMAAPHVAGVAALLLAQGHDADAAVARILETARTPVTGQRGAYTSEYGYGIVDADAATSEPPAGGDAVVRAAGPDRVATAASLSAATRDTAGAVVLARSDDYADALAGGPLAAALDAPLLLTDRASLSAAAAAEIDRLGAERALLLGGRAALSAQVARDLEDLGLDVERIAGNDRYATAALIAERLPDRGEVLLAEGDDPDPGRGWPDALSAAGLGAVTGVPVLLVTTDTLPAATAARLDSRVHAVVVGGPASVSPEVESAVAERVASVRRLAGESRYDTSAAVVREALRRGASAAHLTVATGTDWPDGLAAGPAAAARDGALLLVDGTDLDRSPASRDLVAERSGEIETILVAGGTAVISSRVERQLRQLLE